MTPVAARVSSSQSLLSGIAQDVTRSDYAPVPGSVGVGLRRSRRLVLTVAMGLAGFVLALGLAERVGNEPLVNEQRRQLLDRIAAASGMQALLVTRVADLTDRADQARSEALADDADGQELAAGLSAHEVAAGIVAVTGPGVVVTLSDRPVEDASEEPERVLDADVRLAVNGLLVAGAEAIAVNGQRITAASAIRSAGDAILVNFHPLAPPYVVEAIGPPRRLSDSFASTRDAEALRSLADQFGIGFSTATQGLLRLPGYHSALPESSTPSASAPSASQEGDR